MGDQAITLLDEHAFTTPKASPLVEVLYREHHERVFLAAYRVSGSIQDAEDVLQSIFLRLLKQSGDQNLGSAPERYLCRAAINASLDILRTRRRVDDTVNVDDSVLNNIDNNSNQADSSALADSDVSRSELQRHLRAAITSLNQRAAEIFTLRYFEDFNNAEIAEMLNTSSSSIAVTLHRTRERLQELLREFGGESR